MKKIILFAFGLLLTIICYAPMTHAQNGLTDEEKEEGWKLLFDGESTDQWREYNGDTFPESNWIIEDNTLTFRPGGEGGKDIITREKFENFILKIEWKIAEGGNSGIFYKVMEQPNQAIYWSAPEFQLLDNENHPDAEQGENGNRKSASLYDLIPADPQNANPSEEWNSAKIVVDGSHVEHWQNDTKVLEFELWTPEWYEMIRNSKFREHPEFGDARKGYIGLQDHGNKVSFRNIKIRALD